MSAPTHELSRKVLSLTKPKDKTYKTKNDNIKNILPQLYNIISLAWVCLFYGFYFFYFHYVVNGTATFSLRKDFFFINYQ